MKTEDLLILGAAALAVFVVMGMMKKPTATGAPVGPREVLDNGRPWANGWRYFDNGTAMDPTGQWFANI